MVSDLGERAGEGAEREHGQTPDEDAPVAAQLAKRGERQERDRHGELIGIDHPDGVRRVRAKLGSNGRQRDVGDGTIEHRHRKAGQDHEHRPPPLRQAVSRPRAVHAAPTLTLLSSPLPVPCRWFHHIDFELRRRALLTPRCLQIGDWRLPSHDGDRTLVACPRLVLCRYEPEPCAVML